MEPSDDLLAGLTYASSDDDNELQTNKVWYLKQSPLFANLDGEAVEGVSGIFCMAQYPRKTLLFDVGDTERSIFVIKTGSVRISRLTAEGKEIILALLTPGDVFGEEMLFDSAERTTIAVIHEDALLCRCTADDLFSMLAKDATMAMNVARMLSKRLEENGASVEDLAYAKLADRIMNVLTRLGEEHGIMTTDGIVLPMKLTHAELAALVGSTRESVSVEVSNLVKHRLLKIKGRNFILPTHQA